jgi:hypothetical protein
VKVQQWAPEGGLMNRNVVYQAIAMLSLMKSNGLLMHGTVGHNVNKPWKCDDRSKKPNLKGQVLDSICMKCPEPENPQRLTVSNGSKPWFHHSLLGDFWKILWSLGAYKIHMTIKQATLWGCWEK